MVEDKKTKTLLSHLKNLTDISNQIEEEMKTLPHSDGVTYKGLKPKGGMYVIHSEKGFKSRYEDENGVWYNIIISKR